MTITERGNKMRGVLTITAILVVTPPFALAQDLKSPYAGQEKREIKSLPVERIQEYLSGEGMGLAKAAELNHYPGPKHVMDLAEELYLSKGQLSETEEIYNKMHKEAVRLGTLIVEKEKILDSLFAEQKIDETQLQSLTARIARAQGELRFIHLRAHLEMKRVLSPEQIEKYDTLRGYESGGGKNSHQHHQHRHH
jgi:Spy/CpxP family protein refolding chaperone